MIILKQTATVYGVESNYTVAIKTNLRCVLLPVSGGQTAEERAELNQIRRFFWDGEYQMPDYAQIEVQGRRYQPQRDSITEYTGTVGDKVAIYGCDVVRIP
jgi:hypothetical protein